MLYQENSDMINTENLKTKWKAHHLTPRTNQRNFNAADPLWGSILLAFTARYICMYIEDGQDLQSPPPIQAQALLEKLFRVGGGTGVNVTILKIFSTSM
jgi:hypothetical protein